MLSPRRLAGFVFKVAILYALLAAPWPGVQKTYSAFFRRTGDVLFGYFGSGARARFESESDGGPNADVLAVVETLSPRASRATLLGSRRTGYLPVAQFLALTLATPIVWSRKWRALLWGLVLVNGFVVVRVWGILFFTGNSIAPSQFSVGRFSGDLLAILVSPTPGFVVPAVVWLMVALRPADFTQSVPIRQPEKL